MRKYIIAGVVLSAILAATISYNTYLDEIESSWLPIFGVLTLVCPKTLILGVPIGIGSGYLFYQVSLAGRVLKILAFLVALAILTLTTIWWYQYFSSVPDLQDFPGLQQELDNLEATYIFNSVNFKGEKGNRVIIRAMVDWGVSGDGCLILTDSVKHYFSDHYSLEFQIGWPGDLVFPFGSVANCPMGLSDEPIQADSPTVFAPPPITFLDFTDPDPYLSVFVPEGPAVHLSADGSGDYSDLPSAVVSSEAGTTIYLDAGVHKLDVPLEIEHSLRLIGAGLEETKIVSSAPDYTIRFDGNGTFAAEGISFQHQGSEPADVLVIMDGTAIVSGCEIRGAKHWSREEAPGAGVRLLGDAIGLIQSSNIGYNHNGVLVENQAHITFEGNTCIWNEADCIEFANESKGEAIGNVCSKNGSYGIVVTNQSQPDLIDNICTDNWVAGILYRGQSGGEARGNDCSHNHGSGIVVGDTARPSLDDNICSENGFAGITFGNETGGIARGNECFGSQIGIAIATSATPELSENNCHDNSEADILYNWE